MPDRKPPSFGLLCRAPGLLKEVPRTDRCCNYLGTPGNKLPVFLLHRLSLDWKLVYWRHHLRLLIVCSPSILISLCHMQQRYMLRQFNDLVLQTFLLIGQPLCASHRHKPHKHHLKRYFSRQLESGDCSARQCLHCECQRNLLKLLSSLIYEFRCCLVLHIPGFG